MKTDTILLDHGSGGKMSHHLITDLVLPIFDNAMLSLLHDGAVLISTGTAWLFQQTPMWWTLFFSRVEVSGIWP